MSRLLGRRPTATRTRSKSFSSCLPSAVSKVARMPLPASPPPWRPWSESRISANSLRSRSSSGWTRSRSAPGSRPSVISTTRDLAAQRGVDVAHLQADVAAADDEQPGRHVLQLQRAGRVHDARRGQVERRRLRGHRAGGDDAVLEAVALAALDLDGVRRRRTCRRPGRNRPCGPWHRPDEVAGQRVDDLLPVAADGVDVDLRRAEADADVGGVAGVGDELGGVQQRLGRDAADVQAGAAGPLAGVDERDLEAVVGGEERGGVAAGAAAEDEELRFDGFRHGRGVFSIG